MEIKKIGIILEAEFEIGPNKTSGSITIQKTEDGVVVDQPNVDIVSANGAPPMAIQILGGRIKTDLIEGLDIILRK